MFRTSKNVTNQNETLDYTTKPIVVTVVYDITIKEKERETNEGVGS